MQISRRTVRRLMLGTALLLVPGVAGAQQYVPAAPNSIMDWGNDPQRAQRVQDRARSDYDPIGIRAGSFFIFPSLTLEGGYNSNVYTTEKKAEDSLFVDLTPGVLVRSNFGRHAANFSFESDNRFYGSESDADYNDLTATAAGRLDITRSDLVTANLSLARRHEDNSSPDSNGLREPTNYFTGQLGLAYRHNFNRLYTLVGVDALRYDFNSSDRDRNNDRDRWNYHGNLRVGYELSPSLGVFGEGGYTIVDYDRARDYAGVDRGAKGFDIGVGAQADFSGILWGEAKIGYMERSYDDSDLNNAHGPSVSAKVNWNVTQLTTLELAASSSILETTVQQGGDFASANLQQSIQFDATHELRRNILLTGSLGFIRDDFEGVDRTDNYYQAGVGASYLLNRNLSINANYNFDVRDSDLQNNDFTRSVIRLGVTARM